VLDLGVGRLAQQVAGHQLARVDAAAVQVGDQVVLGVGRLGPHRDRESEPRRLGPLVLLGQDQVLAPRLQRHA
jgi:hypothetical protein